jgi:hypothetical protein
MGEITICFTGICTHLRNLVEGIPHRVVLIHEEREVTINGVTIHSHEPFLFLGRGSVVSGTLTTSPRRVSIRVMNAIGDAPSYDDDYHCAIFRLQGLTESRLTPSRAVVIEGARPAGAYFDVERGAFSAASSPRGATAAVLVVQTDGNPKLSITPMDGGPASKVELTSGSAIAIRNSALAASDHHEGDFLLHYKVFENIPPDTRFPTTPPDCPGLQPLPIPDIELGPGCSNSDWP